MNPLSDLAPNEAQDRPRGRHDVSADLPIPGPRLRVMVLGPLRVDRDWQPLQAARKAQHRPLDLLALLAAQGGRPLETASVIDTLWPSLEANAPRASLDMALCRLRRLLGDPAAVVCAEGQLRLDPQRVWTDVAAFEALVQVAEAGGERAPWQALALYSGPLLGTAPVGPALLARRQQLAQRLCEVALDASARLVACGAADRGGRLLQRAIECEPLCEPLYRRLMQVQLALGENAEALRTAQRCHDLLQSALGIPPSAQTLALAEQARGAPALPQV